MDPLVHLITPGDHYSPSTGSAVPTVVHGLSAATPAGEPRPAVLVARGTYADRYPSADVVEYDDAPPTGLAGRAAAFLTRSPAGRAADAGLGRLVGSRPGARHRIKAPLSAVGARSPSYFVAHNLPQAAGLVRAPHRAVLWAHNELLRTYSPREAGLALGGATVVCVSSWLAEATAARLPRSMRDRVRVVRNGVAPERFATDVPEGRRGDRLEVVMVGRMLPDKGAHVLVDAVARLDRPDVRLTVVGSDGFAPDAPLTPFEVSLRRLAAPLGERVRFVPFQVPAAVAALLAASDVAVVPSVWREPSGLAVLEGMAAGCAVVASAVGGIPELAGSGATLVAPGSPEALADALAPLLADDGALARARQAAFARARESTWETRWPELRAALT